MQNARVTKPDSRSGGDLECDDDRLGAPFVCACVRQKPTACVCVSTPLPVVIHNLIETTDMDTPCACMQQIL